MYAVVLEFEPKENKMQHSMLHDMAFLYSPFFFFFFANNPLYTHATTIVYSTNAT